MMVHQNGLAGLSRSRPAVHMKVVFCGQTSFSLAFFSINDAKEKHIRLKHDLLNYIITM